MTKKKKGLLERFMTWLVPKDDVMKDLEKLEEDFE